jgi:hypothetical protein
MFQKREKKGHFQGKLGEHHSLSASFDSEETFYLVEQKDSNINLMYRMEVVGN